MRRWFHLPQTDRGTLLFTLSIPFALALVAFVTFVGSMVFGVPQAGTLRSTVAGLAYVYLTLTVMWLPSYGVGLAWFAWVTKEDQSRLMSRFYLLPLVAAPFVWFPALMFPGADLAQRLRLFPMLAITAAISGYVWLGIVRFVLYVWRRK